MRQSDYMVRKVGKELAGLRVAESAAPEKAKN